MVPLAQAGRCFLMEIRILSQVTALRDCCCLGFAFPFILAIYSPPCGNTSCSLFSPSGNLGRAQIWGLGGSAALVTFQHSEIPANLNGKGTPACTIKLPWNLLVLLKLGIVITHRGTALGRILQLRELCPAWKTVPEWLSWDQSCSRSVDFLKRWISPFWLELGA